MSLATDLLAPVLRAGLTFLSRRRLPLIEGEIRLAGLHSPVEVIRDRWGVPHLFADDPHDAFFAQGVVHAQDRLWQMELNRRTANGRLSELFGEISLDTDRAVRTFGFRRLGEADWQAAGADLRSVLEAYAEGVNATLACSAARMPIEFTLLGCHPEPWTPIDSLAFSRVMIWQLSHAWYGEILRAKLIEAVGEERAAAWEIHPPLGNPIILPEGIEFNRLGEDGRLTAGRGPFLHRGLGSNNWAVAGWKTDTGMPYLCNDMHLPLGVPSLWYEVHLMAQGMNVSGVSIPGMPLVLVGHTDHIAWGITLAYTDCEDLYAEEFDPEIQGRYRFGEGWRQADIIPEPIGVKGRDDPHIEEVVVTHHGPVISDVVGHPEKRLAVQSMALRPCPAVEGWHRLNLARGWDDFVEAARLIEAPQLSVAYADTEGNTGLWVTGKVPVRAAGKGMVPAPGWSADHEWIGEVPFEAMPHALNPQRGFVATSNDRLVPDDYPHFLGSVWMNGYRNRRISEVLSSKDVLGVEDFRRLHVDFTCPPALEFVRSLEGLTPTSEEAELALELLRGWDGVLSADCTAGTVYEVTRYHLVRNLLEPAVGERLTLQLMGQGFHPLLMPANEFLGHDTAATLRLLEAPESWWMTQAGGRQAVLEKSLKQAVLWLRQTLGAAPSGWGWGKIHRAVFPHAMGLQKPLDRVFNRGPFPIGGDADTPCQTAFNPALPYDNTSWAPGFRQIVDLSDLSKSLIIHPPGQSGQLGSRHYDDLASLWIRGEYHPMLWTRAQIEGEAEGHLHLTP
ncbi:MAG: penicillin acylase family protein [Anaerolineales bacterium]|nr:penicillin acylase family protein [Anaerolineales bacterium]